MKLNNLIFFLYLSRRITTCELVLFAFQRKITLHLHYFLGQINIIVFLICRENDTTQNERISSMIEEKSPKYIFKELQTEGVFFTFVS